MKNSDYVDYILDILSPFGDIRSRKMFGGHGIYQDDIFFALIADDTLYFKVDDSNRPDYEAADSKPFSYEGKDKKTMVMSYWQVPEEILEDHSALEEWINKAVDVARRAKQTKKKKARS